MINNTGNRAAGSPDGSNHADQNKGNQNAFYCSNTGKGHMQHLFCTVMPEESVAEKQQKTEYKRCQNRSSGTDTEKQRSRKQKQDDKFCQMAHLQIVESGFKSIF